MYVTQIARTQTKSRMLLGSIFRAGRTFGSCEGFPAIVHHAGVLNHSMKSSALLFFANTPLDDPF